jgi:glycosyltransferase involved in cell wall biosynthesis
VRESNFSSCDLEPYSNGNKSPRAAMFARNKQYSELTLKFSVARKHTLRVLLLRPQPAIRSLKYVLAFNEVNAQIEPYHGYTAKTITGLYGYGDEYFRKLVRLDLGKLVVEIKWLVKDFHIDLIHSQNAPDFLTRAAVEATDEVPIIHENQDAISLRRTPYTPESDVERELADEKIANEMCDARIHVSRGLMDYVRSRYGTKKEIVVPNYLSKSLVPRSCMRKLSESDGKIHIVYEGTLSSFPGDHYDLKGIFTGLAQHGYHVHIYDSHSNQDYARLADAHDSIHYHGHADPRELLFEMTQYDYGWAGFNVTRNKEHMDVALPNKLFEYLASRLPVLSFPHKAQKEFIEANGVGLVFEDVNDLDNQIKEADTTRRLKRNISRKTVDFTMEANIEQVLNLYGNLLAGRRGA